MGITRGSKTDFSGKPGTGSGCAVGKSSPDSLTGVLAIGGDAGELCLRVAISKLGIRWKIT